jgi:hypothetical protein
MAWNLGPHPKLDDKLDARNFETKGN